MPSHHELLGVLRLMTKPHGGYVYDIRESPFDSVSEVAMAALVAIESLQKQIDASDPCASLRAGAVSILTLHGLECACDACEASFHVLRATRMWGSEVQKGHIAGV